MAKNQQSEKNCGMISAGDEKMIFCSIQIEREWERKSQAFNEMAIFKKTRPWKKYFDWAKAFHDLIEVNQAWLIRIDWYSNILPIQSICVILPLFSVPLHFSQSNGLLQKHEVLPFAIYYTYQPHTTVDVFWEENNNNNNYKSNHQSLYTAKLSIVFSSQTEPIVCSTVHLSCVCLLTFELNVCLYTVTVRVLLLDGKSRIFLSVVLRYVQNFYWCTGITIKIDHTGSIRINEFFFNHRKWKWQFPQCHHIRLFIWHIPRHC